MKKIFEEKSDEKGRDFHIRLYSKKLPSGKCQVKFYLNSTRGNNYYGYMLAEGKDTVSTVVSRIHRCLTEKRVTIHSLCENLNSGVRNLTGSQMLLFEQEQVN